MKPRAEIRPVADFDGYFVCSDGTVWSTKKGKWIRLSPATTKKGYKRVSLAKDGKKHNRYVHRLVLENFVGPRPPGMVSRHFPDRSPSNNTLGNLSYSTPLENEADKFAHGTFKCGEDSSCVKLTERQVKRIHKLAPSMTTAELGTMFKVSPAQIASVCRCEDWKHLNLERVQTVGSRGEHNGKSKLMVKQVKEIRCRLSKGEVMNSIARDFNVGRSLIKKIKRRDLWRHVN